MNTQEFAANIENMTIGLDDTFKFHCDQCGQCCKHREDILLSPMDMYRLSKELNMNPSEFFFRYCQTHVGDTSRMPIVRLRPVGSEMRCPLLKNNRCSVHKAKPSVCALYPLGRYMSIPKDEYSEEGIAGKEVKYLLQPIDCGDESETHTVREWLSGFNIKLEDEAYIRWNQAISKISHTIKELEKKWDMMTMMEVWFVVRVILYEQYHIDQDFLPQFEHNLDGLTTLLQDIPRLKELINRAARS